MPYAAAASQRIAVDQKGLKGRRGRLPAEAVLLLASAFYWRVDVMPAFLYGAVAARVGAGSTA
jgi:hypothetical protein